MERRVCEEWAAVSGVVEEMRHSVPISLIFSLIEPSKFPSRYIGAWGRGVVSYSVPCLPTPRAASIYRITLE